MPKPYFDMQQSGEQVDIYIFGDITDYAWEDSDVSGYRLAQKLEQLKNAAEINVHVDSYGGAVSEGWAIYNALRHQNAQIITHADGFVASAAIYPFLAGKQRIANNVSAFYFHPVIGGARGYSDDLRTAADEIDKLTKIGMGAFTDAGMTEQAATDLLNSKTWYTPEEVLEMGLATSIQKRSKSADAIQSVRDTIIRQMLTAPKQERPPKEPPKQTLLQLFEKL